MDAPLIRDLNDGLPRLDHRVGVGVEVEMALRLLGVAPGNDEDLLAGGDEVLDHAAAGRQVEDVVLVDRRRDEQQRHLAHLGRRRLVLDQLEDLGAQHHRAGGGGEVAADLEALGVDALRQLRRPRNVGGEAPRPAREVRPALVDCRAQHRRVRPGEVGRRQRIEDVVSREPRVPLGLPVELRVGDHAVDGVADRQVALHDPPQQPVLLPGLVGEAPVAAGGRPFGVAGRDARQLTSQGAGAAQDAARVARNPGAHRGHGAWLDEAAGAPPDGRVGEQDVEPCLSACARPRCLSGCVGAVRAVDDLGHGQPSLVVDSINGVGDAHRLSAGGAFEGQRQPQRAAARDRVRRVERDPHAHLLPDRKDRGKRSLSRP